MLNKQTSILILLIVALLFLPQCKSGGRIMFGLDDLLESSPVVESPLNLESGFENAIEENGLVLETKDCEEGQTKPCGINMGACSQGVQACDGGKWGACTGAVDPSAEVCDNIDNNCNETIDEGCECKTGDSRNCAVEKNGVGICKQGSQSCSDGKWGACLGMVGPEEESCDGLDNDCDGSVDENVGTRPAIRTLGVCVGQVEQCVNGAWVGPSYSNILHYADLESKLCDGLDNDCNGIVDEGCDCTPELQRSCEGSNVGVCRSGMQTCSETGSWGECVGAVSASPEICDGLDNDCNGSIDDGLIVGSADKSVGLCAGKTKICGQREDGTYGSIEPNYNSTPGYRSVESIEQCDGLDNDCDGTVDEGCECVDGQTRYCGPTTNYGICAYGTQTCYHGSWGGCVGEIMPEAIEHCDGLDNDCNGQTDEGLIPPSANKIVGVCANMKKECQGTSGWVEPNYNSLSGYESHETLCDGLDNDCDGYTDVGCACILGDTRQCGSDFGVCSRGTQTCNIHGVWGDCLGGIGPSTEICNGLDDNCDGIVDEGFGCVRGQTEPCGTSVGACRMGIRECTNSCEWSACKDDTSPVSETCDGVDNDCDGDTDEGLIPLPADKVVGVCSNMKKECQGTSGLVEPNYTIIDSYENVETQCDGLDNDCDGTIDEGCDCIDGATEECGIDIGECQHGTRSCIAGKWGECEGERNPMIEQCNGLDDDCDGYIDNGVILGLSDKQQGVCSGARKVCVSGMEQEPDYVVYSANRYQVVESSCDGLDNDCDGLIDESLTRTCSNGCAGSDGTERCISGSWADCTARIPTTEICDGQDNNCNGKIDEDLTPQPCATACGAGHLSCVAGTWSSCTARTPSSSEICDGTIDDDCDGTIDNGCSCTNGKTRTCGPAVAVGQCMSGVEICEGGIWDACIGAVEPALEICDGIDNDCNGIVDDVAASFLPLAGMQSGVCAGIHQICRDGILAEPDYTGLSYYEANERTCDGRDNDCDGITDEAITRSCATACEAGVETCKINGTGEWNNDCTARIPVSETCDGLDNNCDGLIDEGLTRGCETDCGEGTETCKIGDWMACTARSPQTEICDGVDNDCNGEIDEGCECIVGTTQSCGSDVGECGHGTQYCTSVGWGVCEGEIVARDEVCDGKDNDCDGSIDEGLSSRVCSNACGTGTESCVGGRWANCNARTPTVEVCDGQDNDCDGSIDEDLAPQSCTTACEEGLRECVSGKWGNCDARLPTTEICDGIDNNCNDEIDEGGVCGCTPGETRSCASGYVGICANGMQTCKSNGRWGTCHTAVLPGQQQEICGDGLDNDCNEIVDDCSVTVPPTPPSGGGGGVLR